MRSFLRGLADRHERPRAILVVSAHWETTHPRVSATAHNETIHDFHGFPAAAFAMRYDAPGSPEIAARTIDLLNAAGVQASPHPTRGLDHGAWVPLSLIYPDADIPVFQVSIQSRLDPEYHLRLGRALALLRDEGVLIIGSGSLTHDLGSFRGTRANYPAVDWVDAFADWTNEALREGRIDDLIDYRRRAPFAERNHPTDEHLLPLYVAIGAAGEGARVERLHKSTTFGILRMDVFAFGN